MSKRYSGNVITPNPVEPAGPYQDDAANGVWSLAEALAYGKEGLWPTAGNEKQIAIIFGGFASGNGVNVIQQVGMATSGTTTDFGDLISTTYDAGSAASSTRAINLGGTKGDNARDRMEYVTIASAGNSTDFGDIDKSGTNNPGISLPKGTTSNQTRGIIGPDDISTRIDYITIATTGNSVNFGELYFGYTRRGGLSSPTRAFFMGGQDGADNQQNRIDSVVIASTGNYYSSWGSLTVSRKKSAGASNGTRGVVFAGQNSSEAGYNIIDYFDLVSSGNASDFGDLSAATEFPSTFSNKVYAYCNSVGGTAVTASSTIEYVTIASAGNSTDFGDLYLAVNRASATSDSHGGLS